MVDCMLVRFLDWEEIIFSCFYEFVLCYLKVDGNLYIGFVVVFVDKIFESINVNG